MRRGNKPHPSMDWQARHVRGLDGRCFRLPARSVLATMCRVKTPGICSTHLSALVLWLWLIQSGQVQAQPSSKSGPADQKALQSLVDSAVATTLVRFAARNFRADQVAVTLVDLRHPATPVRASHRGDVQIYPASVVKLFYLVAAHRWMEDGKLADTPELRRAMRDMIVESYNEATHYVVDLLTDTTSGPELSEKGIDE